MTVYKNNQNKPLTSANTFMAIRILAPKSSMLTAVCYAFNMIVYKETNEILNVCNAPIDISNYQGSTYYIWIEEYIKVEMNQSLLPDYYQAVTVYENKMASMEYWNMCFNSTFTNDTLYF